MKSFDIPIPTLRRLPLYYQHLLAASRRGDSIISSTELGEATGSAPEQVRKDLSFLAGQGKSHVGYEINKLIRIIETYLGLVTHKAAVIIGAGNLGHALALYPGFSQYGLKILALFDNDSKKINDKVGKLLILPMEELPKFIKSENIRIGILTTPPEAASQITNIMVTNGIKAIWNFSTAHLTVPEDVLVRNVDLSLELGVISHYLTGLDRLDL
ncbi:MAG: redox-sensing transcriptional repressor Rex [Anaerolineaceae bacterium]